MANPHFLLHRQPGRRDAERQSFARLMAKVEKIRLRDGMTKKQLAAEIGTEKSVLLSWLSGEAIVRAESVATIQQFIQARI